MGFEVETTTYRLGTNDFDPALRDRQQYWDPDGGRSAPASRRHPGRSSVSSRRRGWRSPTR
jgi:hypothetical protein